MMSDIYDRTRHEFSDYDPDTRQYVPRQKELDYHVRFDCQFTKYTTFKNP